MPDQGPVGGLVDRSKIDAFEDGDPEFFIAAAEQSVRTYCGWHIAPSLTITDGRYRSGERGLVILPSLHVTDVASVSVDGRVLGTTEYDWEPCGFISRRVPSWPRDPYVTVSFTHGYEECPADVAAVVFELASKAMEMPASPARDVTAGPFRLTLTSAIGVSLSRDQQSRLATYRIQGIA